MRRLQTFAAFVLLLAVMGCANQHPMQQWAMGTEAYNSALEMLIMYRKAGVIDDEEYMEVERIRRAAALALDSFEVAALNDSPNTADYLEAFNNALDQLLLIQLQNKREAAFNGN